MRRVGLVLLAIGIAGFLFASAQRARYASPSQTASVSGPARQRASARWETARWMLVGTAVMGLVFTVLPGKER